MDITTLRIGATVASFATFLAILAWAFARRNRSAFEDAAALPFTGEIDPDESDFARIAPGEGA